MRAKAERLAIGSLELSIPVILAPMAGITHYPFRKLCREMGAGLYVSEMVAAHALVNGNQKTLKIADFGPDENPRSIQLSTVCPDRTKEAVTWLVANNLVDHIDINFGCPVKKITRKGGGAALPLKEKLFANIIAAAVQSAGAIPITVKMRKGIDDEHLSYLSAGKIAEEEGASAVGLHARTAEELYSGKADWAAIKRLKATVKSIPVLGNGDIWQATDATQMMKETQCDGVIIGRGCLGNPWIFRDLQALFTGKTIPNKPRLDEVINVMTKHIQYTEDWFGGHYVLRAFRKHLNWYLEGFSVYASLKKELFSATSTKELIDSLNKVKSDEQYPTYKPQPMHDKKNTKQVVALPHNYYNELYSTSIPEVAAENSISGG